MKRLYSCHKGFTLIEVMIATAVLGIGLLAFISLHVSSIRENENAIKFTEAALANQSQIEYFILVNYAMINNNNPTTQAGYTEVDAANTNFANLYAIIPNGYTVEYRVTNLIDINADGTDDAMQINLRTKDTNGKIRSDLTFIKTRA